MRGEPENELFLIFMDDDDDDAQSCLFSIHWIIIFNVDENFCIINYGNG